MKTSFDRRGGQKSEASSSNALRAVEVTRGTQKRRSIDHHEKSTSNVYHAMCRRYVVHRTRLCANGRPGGT